MAHEHNYKLTAVWTGNKGDGTKNVRFHLEISFRSATFA